VIFVVKFPFNSGSFSFGRIGLEFQARFTGTFGNGFDPAVVQKAVAVKNDLFESFFLCTPANDFSHTIGRS
jgi:hypothetical protein